MCPMIIKKNVRLTLRNGTCAISFLVAVSGLSLTM
jgi:hypothetical protein